MGLKLISRDSYGTTNLRNGKKGGKNAGWMGGWMGGKTGGGGSAGKMGGKKGGKSGGGGTAGKMGGKKGGKSGGGGTAGKMGGKKGGKSGGDEFELYDIVGDPTDQTNLASQSVRARELEMLQAYLACHLQRTDPNDPIDCDPDSIVLGSSTAGSDDGSGASAATISASLALTAAAIGIGAALYMRRRRRMAAKTVISKKLDATCPAEAPACVSAGDPSGGGPQDGQRTEL